MSDSLTFNKYAGAVLATGFVIALLYNVSGMVFSQGKVAKPGFKVEVSEETGGAAAAPEVPPDWGTVLKTADVAAGQATFAKCQSCHSLTANGTGPNLTGVVGRKPGTEPGATPANKPVATGSTATPATGAGGPAGNGPGAPSQQQSKPGGPTK
jgi:cytochrome c